MPVLTPKKYRVIIKKGTKTHLAYLVTFPTDFVHVGMNKLHKLVELQGLSTHSRLGFGPMFKLVLETAVISPLSASSLEAQSTFKEIIIESSKPSPALTKGFNDTSLLSHVLFASVGAQFMVLDVPEEIQTLKEAVLVKRQVTFFGWLCALMAALIVAVVAGVVVGVLAHDAKIGIMVATGIAALVGCVEAY